MPSQQAHKINPTCRGQHKNNLPVKPWADTQFYRRLKLSALCYRNSL